jgi:predicted NAD/FAD-dependent oxidoreductase
MEHDIRAVGVIGAGLSGLACARRLRDAGLAVRLFDKGRSPGGRISTRRVETAEGPVQFDHGAQFFTARHPDFCVALERLPTEASLLWRGPGVGEDWRVAAPGMSALPKALAARLDVLCSTRVDVITRRGECWDLIGEQGVTIGSFDHVVVATPAEQAVPLLAPIAPHLALEATQAVTAPCWAGLFAFSDPLTTERAAYEFQDHPVLSWVACDATKPGRRQGPQGWVVHARPDWTRRHLEEGPGDVAPRLLNGLAAILESVSEPLLMQAHRWRYAKVERAAGMPFGWDARLGVGVCGDWRLGPRVELAWRSGHDLAGAMLA